MSEQYKIRSINDMVVTVDGGQGLSMQDMVYLGDKRLIGEVVGVDSEKVTVQVYDRRAHDHPAGAWPAARYF